jgi:ubiquitin-like-conjugating enzyme ATG3
MRASALIADKSKSVEVDLGEDDTWVMPTEGTKSTAKVTSAESSSATTTATTTAPVADEDDDDDIPDMDEFDAENLEDEDPAALASRVDDDNVIRTRTYDITICYDKYYQTPRVWLFGYDEV